MGDDGRNCNYYYLSSSPSLLLRTDHFFGCCWILHSIGYILPLPLFQQHLGFPPGFHLPQATSTFLEVGLIPSTYEPISFPRTVIDTGPDPIKMILRTLAYYHKPENYLSISSQKKECKAPITPESEHKITQATNLSSKQIWGSVDKILELKLSPLSSPEPLEKPTLKYTRVLEFQLEV